MGFRQILTSFLLRYSLTHQRQKGRVAWTRRGLRPQGNTVLCEVPSQNAEPVAPSGAPREASKEASSSSWLSNSKPCITGLRKPPSNSQLQTALASDHLLVPGLRPKLMGEKCLEISDNGASDVFTTTAAAGAPGALKYFGGAFIMQSCTKSGGLLPPIQ